MIFCETHIQNSHGLHVHFTSMWNYFVLHIKESKHKDQIKGDKCKKQSDKTQDLACGKT